MTSTEIKNRLNELEAEKSKLEAELTNAMKLENNKKEEELFLATKTAILKLWEIYWKDEDNSESKKRLDTIKYQYALNMWLEADIQYVLKKSKLNDTDIDIIKNIIKDIPDINFNKCIRNAKIRLDFATALKNVKKGYELSGQLDYGFSHDDLLNLMELHKSNKYRKKIEDLLTDCNFHTECGFLSSKEYDKLKDYIEKDK